MFYSANINTYFGLKMMFTFFFSGSWRTNTQIKSFTRSCVGFFSLQLQCGITAPEERYDNISPYLLPELPPPEASLTSSHVVPSSGRRRQADKNTSTQYIITWIWIIRGDPSDCKGALPVDPINFKLRALIYLQMAAPLQGAW